MCDLSKEDKLKEKKFVFTLINEVSDLAYLQRKLEGLGYYHFAKLISNVIDKKLIPIDKKIRAKRSEKNKKSS